MEQSGSYGQYDLLRFFNRGQVTEVFLARDRNASGAKSLLVVHRVVPPAATNRAFVDAFLNEVGVAGSLKHPNIIEIFDLGEEDGGPFLAQEYVSGGSVDELLDRRGESRLPLGDALYIVGEACAGLQYAHALAGPDGVPRNLVHGALNLRHLLVSVTGAVKVADFGMAAAVAHLGAAPPGDPRETEAFLAPEQVQGQAVDRRADIYACGALLYRLVTGELPGSTLDGSFQPPEEILPEIPQVLARTIVKAMAGNPKDRQPTCGALRREISKVAKTMALDSDRGSLAKLVQAEFPEASASGEGDDRAAPAPAPAVLSSGGSDPGLGAGLPAPGAASAVAVPAAAVPTPAPTPAPSAPAPADDSLDDDVPFLDDADLLEERTGQYDAVDSDSMPDLGPAVVPAQPQPSDEWERPAAAAGPGMRWIIIAAIGGAVVAAGIVLLVVFLLWPPGEPEPDYGMAHTLPGVGVPPVTPPGTYVPPVAPPTPPAIPPTAVPGTDPSAPKPPGQDAGPADPTTSPGSQPDAAPAKTPERPPEKTSDPPPTKRPTKSDEPRRPLGKGYIYVLTSPTSRVYFDGRLLGTTPIMKRSVPAGRHSLRLVTAGFPPKQLRTHIERGKVTQVRHLFRQQ